MAITVLQFIAYLWMLQYVTLGFGNCKIKVIRLVMFLWAVSAEDERVSKIMCSLTSEWLFLVMHARLLFVLLGGE